MRVSAIIFLGVYIVLVTSALTNPKMTCQSITKEDGGGFTLHMPLPHCGELGVSTPDDKFLFVAFAPEEDVNPPIDSSTFKSLDSFDLLASTVGLAVISPDSKPERVFTTSGRYRIIVSDNLETEDDLQQNLICDVEFRK